MEEFPTITDGELEEMIASAEHAFQSWRQVPITERTHLVARVGQLFTERKDQLAAIITGARAVIQKLPVGPLPGIMP